jgi:hypothetical protein
LRFDKAQPTDFPLVLIDTDEIGKTTASPSTSAVSILCSELEVSSSTDQSSRTTTAATSEHDSMHTGRVAKLATVQNWLRDYDKDLQTLSWLQYDSTGSVVTALKCLTCTRYEDKVRSCKNFSPAFIEGTKQVKTSTFKAHAESIMHGRSMKLHKKNQGACFEKYAPKVVPVIAPRWAYLQERK